MTRWTSLLRWPLALVAALALTAGCTTLDHKQREWIFQPSQNAWPTSRAEDMQDVWITHRSKESGDDVKLKNLFVNQIPKSGREPQDVLDYLGLGAKAILQAV